MKRQRDNQGIDLTGRIASLEQFTGSLVARPRDEAADRDAVPIDEAPPLSRVATPRRSRVFLRSVGGRGAFADLTLASPVAQAAD